MDQILIERIEQVLRIENVTAQGFSRVLFGPGGLFPQLGPTEAERRQIVQTDLFRRANERMTELIKRELAEDQKRKEQIELSRREASGQKLNLNGEPQSN